MGRDITKLHPFTRMLADELVRRCEKAGLIIKITDCVRTKEEQEDCIKRGTSSVGYGYSYHNWGLAFDFCRNDGKGAYNESGEFFYKVGAIGSALGLEWGGTWQKLDKPHFQFNGFTRDENQVVYLLQQFRQPEAFFRDVLYKWNKPTLEITPKSNFKKILWLQVRLNIHGIKTDMDGIWGPQTINSVKKYWKRETGNECTGKRISLRCINMLDKKLLLMNMIKKDIKFIVLSF